MKNALLSLTLVPWLIAAPQAAAQNDWWQQVYEKIGDLYERKSVDQLTLTIEEQSKIEASFSLGRFPEDVAHPDLSVKTVETPTGPREEYYYKGKKMGYYSYPGGTFVSNMTLTWDGKAIPIPANFYNDLGGMTLEKVQMLREPKEGEQGFAQSLRSTLFSPTISLSADGGTVLITWVRPEE